MQYIIGLFNVKDIVLTINGSKIVFTKEGDIQLYASRNLDIRGKYIFQNCSDSQITNIMYGEQTQCMEQLEEETL